jgi:hypothetical protein
MTIRNIDRNCGGSRVALISRTPAFVYAPPTLIVGFTKIKDCRVNALLPGLAC